MQIVERVLGSTVVPAREALLAYSGGLDSTLCIELLRRVYHVEKLYLLLFDVGQGAEEIERARRSALALGAPEPTVVSLRRELYEDWIPRAIYANASFRGYPIAAPIAKQLLALQLAEICIERGIQTVAEGSSGRGNDQFRMSAPFSRHAPGVRVIAPIRDLNLTRFDEEALCEAWGVPYVRQGVQGGDDITLWCRSIGSGAVALDTELTDDIWLWYRAPAVADPRAQEALVVTVGFEEGCPVSLDGERADLISMLEYLNVEAGRRGVGRVDIVEDGILGLKSREIYEAPAATLLLAAHRELEYLCLTAEELRFKSAVDASWLELVYGAKMFHPLVEALDAFIRTTQRAVSGEVTFRVAGGNLQITQRSSNNSLYSRALRHLGESAFDQRLLEGAVFAHGLPMRALHERDTKVSPAE